MLPSMVQGLKLGWAFSWRSLMAAELLYSAVGLGHLLQVGRDLNDMPQVVSVMAVIVAIGLTVDRLVFGPVDLWVRTAGAARITSRTGPPWWFDCLFKTLNRRSERS